MIYLRTVRAWRFTSISSRAPERTLRRAARTRLRSADVVAGLELQHRLLGRKLDSRDHHRRGRDQHHRRMHEERMKVHEAVERRHGLFLTLRTVGPWLT